MDEIDRKLLLALQRDASVSIASLAADVGLSQTPAWKRIQRLERTGVIIGKVALVAPEQVGLGLTVFVQIETREHSAEWLDDFAKTVIGMPEVVEFYRMAGEVDYMLRVIVPDMKAYDGFYKALIGRFALKNVTSHFAMERLKQTTALPIPPLRPSLAAGDATAS